MQVKSMGLAKFWIYQFGDEPEVMYVLKRRDDEYLVVYDDAWDQSTGKTEYYNKKDFEEKFNIKLHD
jgi:hypothetical protein